jgi:16S rRNA (adenine1518-N6/adenine1519-N6)-dimethyltransferase
MRPFAQKQARAPAPKKSLGQNWLVDEHHLDQIVAVAGLTQADTVLEIGPGLGHLTRRLAARAGRVVAVELDDRLIPHLRQQFADQPQVTIVHGDILALEPAHLVVQIAGQGDKGTRGQEDGETGKPGDKETRGQGDEATGYKVVANLPYYITSVVLRHLLEATPPPTQAVLLVQKEVAERICAAPGDLSLLAVSVQYYAEPRLVHRVPASAFRPQPQVDSAVLRLDIHPTPTLPDLPPELFFRVVRAGFSQKRKQLLNTLSAALHLPKTTVAERLQQAGIEPTRRAETLSLAEWGRLCRLLMV